MTAGGPPSPPFWNLPPALPAPAPLQCGRAQCRSGRRSGDTGCRALSCQAPARPGRAPGPTRSSSWPPHGPTCFQLEAVLVLQLLLSSSLTLPRPGQTSWLGARCRQQGPGQASLRPHPFHGEGPRRAWGHLQRLPFTSQLPPSLPSAGPMSCCLQRAQGLVSRPLLGRLGLARDSGGQSEGVRGGASSGVRFHRVV